MSGLMLQSGKREREREGGKGREGGREEERRREGGERGGGGGERRRRERCYSFVD